jgi:ABC-2 type transport system permease protein
MISQFVGALGFAQFFPWSVPMLFAGGTGPDGAQLGLISYIIVLLTGIIGISGTIVWWKYADQK